MSGGLPRASASASPIAETPTTTPVTTSTTSTGAPKKTKKVRSACERCRYRRIKCDGQVPACGNCSKAEVLCIDVDGGDTERRIVRGQVAHSGGFLRRMPVLALPGSKTLFGHTFPIRVSISKKVLPCLQPHTPKLQRSSTLRDLPQAPMASPEFPKSVPGHQIYPNLESREASGTSNSMRGQKRPLSTIQGPSSRETSVEQDTRSVALDLSLLSLNSESRHIHYLGSSPGSLFASLFQARKNGDSRNDSSLREAQDGVEGDCYSAWPVDMPHLEEDLSEHAECDLLLKRFFQHMHPNHPFLHRPSFDNIVDALYQCVLNPPDTPIQYNGWPSTVAPFDYNGEEHISPGRQLIPISAHVAAFQYFVALSIGATLQIRSRKYSHNPEKFFNSAISLSTHVFGTISLPVLQAVLLLIVHSLIDPAGCNVWTLTHAAMAHAVDLGIHREVSTSGKFSNLAVQMRRRVFLCVYSCDRYKSISTIQGRPLGLGDDTFDDGTYISQIKYGFYRLPSLNDDFSNPESLVDKQNQLRHELDQWLAESSAAILATVPPDQRLRLSTKLKIQYHAAMCLSHQPSQAISDWQVTAEKERSGSDNPQEMASLEVNNANEINPFIGGEDTESALVQDAFMTHDGQLANIFDNTMPGFLDRMPIY
ncbi:uncharacterized protein PAC_01884 [Phialocephala subalpina]|uniref:Zn(2)-C6 fungal-type domain-containing protein n=1 Tax=Phialocephala subalpina TaxID=576137 RepID=A0A1L7WGX7_9HELO|nr:uncharacterized protein PAC_01884 [Phialocephala subalpina]